MELSWYTKELAKKGVDVVLDNVWNAQTLFLLLQLVTEVIYNKLEQIKSEEAIPSGVCVVIIALLRGRPTLK